ncbi:hypothetical protein [Microbacterium sp. NPDC056569]|uniref:hypothetical protein n=1 Tax=Microbacterium sp. NPDC056569 TaxID=3345867 RepID=UPI003671E3A3
MDLYPSVVESIRAQRALLEADLVYWAGRASGSGDLPQHTSQVARLREQIAAALAATVDGTPVAADARMPFDGDVDELPGLRRGVGTVHLMWDFFRSKLAQRDTPAYALHLGAADDLAWSCYKPFLDAARRAGTVGEQELKEPPLVFYSTDRTPFAQARSKAFHAPGLDAKDLDRVVTELQRMPVPVVAMPWALANRLPDVVFVGHEVGHVIAEDLGFGVEAKTVIGGLALKDDDAGERRDVWRAWSDEIFADVVGVLATGTAFVIALAGELADAVNAIEHAAISAAKPGVYPTRSLRIALCGGVLERLGVKPPQEWAEVYRVAGDSEAYAQDVPALVEALLEHVWAPVELRLPDVLSWNGQLEDEASAVARSVLRKTPAPVPFNARLWIAAAVQASVERPEEYARLALDTSMATFIVRRRNDRTRSVRGVAPSDAGEPVTARGGAHPPSSDQAAGEAMAERLGLNPSRTEPRSANARSSHDQHQ